MTTQTSYSDKKVKSTDLRFFLGELKRSWPKAVFYFIVFMLVLPIPFLLGVVKHSPIINNEMLVSYSENILSFLKDDYVPAWTITSALVALFAGISSMNYLHNKVSADYYHSIPIRRESLYLTKLTVGFVDFLAAIIVNTLILLIICGTRTLSDGYGAMITTTLFRNLGYSVLAFLFAYSTVALAGALSGTSAMHLVMSLYLNFILLLYLLWAAGISDMFIQYLDINYYTSYAVCMALSPILRLLIGNQLTSLKFYQIVLYILASAAIYLLALFIYKKRHVEKAGTPIVFGKFEKFFKYTVMIPATMLSGLFFHDVSGDEGWLVFGLIIGALLSFMLLNAVLAKNARKIFSGMRAFAVYAVIFAVCFALIPSLSLKLDRYVPSEKTVKKLEITISNDAIDSLEFKDPDVIREMISADKNTVNGDELPTRATAWEATIERIYSDIQNYRFKIVYRTKIGFPIARKITIPEDNMAGIADAIANSDEFEDAVRQALEEDRLFANVGYEGDFLLGSFGIYTEQNVDYSTDYVYDIEKYDGDKNKAEYIAKYLSDHLTDVISSGFEEVSDKTFDRQIIGHVSCYLSSYHENLYTKVNEFPIFAGNKYFENITGCKTLDEYYGNLADKITTAIIIKGARDSFSSDEENVMKVTDRDKIIELLRSVDNLTENEFALSVPEKDYYVTFLYDNENVTWAQDPWEFSTRFLEGKVPAFVANSFN